MFVNDVPVIPPPPPRLVRERGFSKMNSKRTRDVWPLLYKEAVQYSLSVFA